MPRFPIGDLALSATVLGPTTTASFEGGGGGGGGGCGGGGGGGGWGGVVSWHGLLLFTSRPILAVNGGLCWFCNFPKEILFRKPPVLVLTTSGGWCSRHETVVGQGKVFKFWRPAPSLLCYASSIVSTH